MSGLDFVRALHSGETSAPPITELLDFGPTSIEEGRARFALEPGEQHYNPIGFVHGGVMATLLDTVMAVAVHTTLSIGEWYTSIEIKVNYTRPVTVDTGTLTGEGWVVHRGRRIATAEGRVTSPEGKLVAHGSTTCMIMHE